MRLLNRCVIVQHDSASLSTVVCSVQSMHIIEVPRSNSAVGIERQKARWEKTARLKSSAIEKLIEVAKQCATKRQS